MRLLIIGTLSGQLGAASQIAMRRGAEVVQTDDIVDALRVVRAGNAIDLILIDVTLDVASLIAELLRERITLPVVACGLGSDTRAAVAAVKAGAREYLPLPPDPELIGAILAAISEVARRWCTPIHAWPRFSRWRIVSPRRRRVS